MSPAWPDRSGRDQQAILDDLLRRLPGYAPELSPGSTTARTLMQILARYMELLGAGLDRVPERSFLAFLEMLGAQLLPAQAARAPLVFGLIDGSPVDLTLPARSQVAAALPPVAPSLASVDVIPVKPPSQVVFATEQSITLCRSKLVTLYSVLPGSDEFADHSASLTTGFSLFEDVQPCEHAIYLGHDQLFALAGEITLILAFTLETGGPERPRLPPLEENDPCAPVGHRSVEPRVLPRADAGPGPALQTRWEYLTEHGWLPFTNLAEDDTTQGLRDDGQLVLRRSCGPDAKKATFAGRTSFWVRGRLATSLVPQEGTGQPLLPVVNDIRASVKFSKANLLPEAAFNGSLPLDVSKDFLPFGAQPATLSVFYLASQEVFQRKGAQVTLTVDLTQEGRPSVGADGKPLELTWEYNNGRGWSGLGVKPTEEGADRFLKRGIGMVSFLCPSDWGEAAVSGVKNYWLRVRITGGDYGLPLRAGPVPTRAIQAISVDSAAGQITVMTITVGDNRGYVAGQSVVLAKGAARELVTVVRTQGTDAVTVGETVALPADFLNGTISAADGPLLASTLVPPIIKRLTLGYSYVTDPEALDHCLAHNDFVFEDQSEACRWPDQSFTPFRLVTDRSPTVHFGFDRPLPVGLVSLFLDVASGEGAEVSSPFVWEYRSPRGWTELAVVDQTLGFTRSGLVQLIGAPDAIATDGLGGERYRLRARVKRGQRPATAAIRGLWLNAVWATHSESFEREPLGTSDGNPRQTFDASRTPVLVGETVWVEEWTGRGEYWRTFVQHVAEDDLRFDRDPANDEISAVWVAWHLRPHLHDSGSLDRHYAIERARGLVRFGDGHRGMIPPAGRRIVMSYTSGGGLAGNVPAGAIAEVRTAVPFIMSATNPVAASGGAPTEAMSSVQARGPQRLRHRDRAVSTEDFEWLAREASPEVARARCLPVTGPAGRGQRGWVTLLLVPHGIEEKPTPSAELKRRVREHLAARAPATVARRLRVEGPRYVPVSVSAELVPLPAQSVGALEARLRDRLDRFLHPLTGGVAQQGWDFGQTVHLSQIASVLEGTEGVDFARGIRLGVEGRLYDDSVPVDTDMLVAPGDHEIKLVLGVD